MPKSRSRRRSQQRKGPSRSTRDEPEPEATLATKRGVSKTAGGSGKLHPPYQTWHRPAGWSLVALGIFVAVVNDLEYLGIGLMPGGHNELYLFVGVALAAWGAYFLGAFSAD